MARPLAPNWVAVAALAVIGVVVADVVRRAVRADGRRAAVVAADSNAKAAAPANRVRPKTQGSAGTSAAAPAGSTAPGPSYMEQLGRAETRRRIRASAGVTYLDAILATSGDSMLHRWDNRVAPPVRVALTPGRAANFQPAFLDAIRQAFARWGAIGLPVRFDLDADTGNANVRIAWRVQFEMERTGQTDLSWDQDGHLESGVMTFATFDAEGRPMGPDDIRIVALHEIGHLLGLDHSPDSADVMFPATRARDLSERDIRTAQLLYELAPGSLR